MKNLYLGLFVFMVSLSFYSVSFAQYYGHLYYYLGEDEEYVKNQCFLSEKNYKFSVDNNGFDTIRYTYREDNKIIVEVLTFNDEGMGYSYSVLRRFNDYNELIQTVKKEDNYLHSLGIVHYENSGYTWASNWEFNQSYYLEGYDLFTFTTYTDRGEYKAYMNLIDKKFDRIQNGY